MNNIIYIILAWVLSFNISQSGNIHTDASNEAQNAAFEYTTYGQYGNRDFMEAINNNLIDQTMSNRMYASVGEAVNAFESYEDNWQNELDRTYEALVALKDDKTLDSYDKVIELIDNLEPCLNAWSDYLSAKSSLEADFFSTGQSVYVPAISLNRTYEIREMALKLKEYYYIITGDVIFYYDDVAE